MARSARVAASTALLPIAVALVVSSCEIVAGIRDHTPLPIDGGSGGASASGGSGAGGAGQGGSSGGVAGAGAGGSGLGGHVGTGGAGTGGSGSGGSIGTGGSGSGGMSGSGGKTGAGGNGGASCITTFAGQLLYSFDTAASVQGWMPVVGGPAVTQTSADGHACPGALTITVPFPYWGGIGSVEVSTGTLNLNQRIALHAWVKVFMPAQPGYSVLESLSIYIVSMDSMIGTIGSNKVSDAASFSDGNWHEIVLNLVTATPPPALYNVTKIGFSLHASSSQPVDAGDTPGTVTFLVDDIWAE